MSILIKKALIIAPKSKHHKTKKDILIKNGQILKIAQRITDSKAKVIESKNLHVSVGWLDVGATSGEPGFEHRESFESMSKTAAAGGYTGLAIFPNTNPVIDNKSTLQYVLNSTSQHLVDYFPIGSVSKNCAGEEITEMIDMSKNGAVAFSDGQKSIDSNGLFLRALEYVKTTGKLIIHRSDDPSISNGNDIHEGETSTSLGLKASPSLSEHLILERDIHLSEYAESRLLIHNISSSESIQKIKNKKSKNLFSSVSCTNLCLTEKSIENFDTNCKVSPPLRSQSDKENLIAGVNSGSIDIITSNHVPLEDEHKKKEFVYAKAGAIGLQTCFSSVVTFAKSLKLERIIKCLSENPRKILDIDMPAIELGEKANLTLFDPDLEWTFDDNTNYSKSKNSPFWNHNLKGKVIGVVNGKYSFFNNY